MNFMRMPTEMFDEILDRVGPKIAKQHTFWRAPLDPGMKLATLSYILHQEPSIEICSLAEGYPTTPSLSS